MILGGRNWGRDKNALTKVFCDACKRECTDDFFEVFYNHWIRSTSTAQNPFVEQEKVRFQYCPACYEVELG